MLERSAAEAVACKLTTIATLAIVFPKAQRSQSEARKKTEIKVSGNLNRQKSKKKKQKIRKNKTTKN